MSKEEFGEYLSNMKNFEQINVPRIPALLKSTEKRAKKIIADMDTRYRAGITNTMKNYSTVIHVRENNYNGRNVYQFQVRTGGCTMKQCGSCWNCNYGLNENCTTKPEEYIEKFKELISKYGTGDKVDTLVMEAMGSITDNREFSREALLQMIDIALREGNFNSLTLETHITQIDEELVRYIDRINSSLPVENRKRIAFEVGIEDFNPDNRELINKLGVKNSKIDEVYQMLDKYGFELDCNLIYGFPFLTEDERIEAMRNNIRYAKDHLPNAGIILFLMSIKDNTIMKNMQEQGHYRLPNPWGFVEVAKIAIEEGGDNYIGFSWFGEKEDPIVGQQKAYHCPDCQKLIINGLKSINGTMNREERRELMKKLINKGKELSCSHYNEFLEELEVLRSRDSRKSPKTRLHDYYIDVINKETGAKIDSPEGPEL